MHVLDSEMGFNVECGTGKVHKQMITQSSMRKNSHATAAHMFRYIPTLNGVSSTHFIVLVITTDLLSPIFFLSPTIPPNAHLRSSCLVCKVW